MICLFFNAGRTYLKRWTVFFCMVAAVTMSVMAASPHKESNGHSPEWKDAKANSALPQGPIVFPWQTPILPNLILTEPKAQDKSNLGPVILIRDKMSGASEEVENTEGMPLASKIPSPPQSVDSLPPQPRVSIIIDDLGYNRRGMEASLALPNEVALAILPQTPFALKTAKAAHKTQRITLLHAPMENEKALNLGPGGLYSHMDREAFIKTLREDLESVPGVIGVNNHMGSLLTQKKRQMEWVMDVIEPENLFFVDSLTSPNSVARSVAEHYGLKTAQRDVFLDNIPTEVAIARQYERLLSVARTKGSAIAIGHPYPETMVFLSKHLHQLKSKGVILVPLDQQLK